MTIHSDYSLGKLNTFGIAVSSKFFASVSSLDDVNECLIYKKLNKLTYFVLGGGSNILFTQNFDGLVLKVAITGKEIINSNDEYVWVKCGGGETWHDLVMYCIDNNLGGIENLSLIPGCAGAAPIQNIGAYGVELKDVFYELEAVEIISGEMRNFSASECRFGYRDSIFKNAQKDKYIITSIILKLNKKHILNTSYGTLEQELQKTSNGAAYTIRAVSEAVCRIRRSKLPDPAVIGNAGSFFKNPIVPKNEYQLLKQNYPDIVAYNNGLTVKIAAGWLIEKAGWKGKRFGNCGVHTQQALVLVNYGNAKGSEIIALSKEIQQDVEEKFGIRLDAEVNIV